MALHRTLAVEQNKQGSGDPEHIHDRDSPQTETGGEFERALAEIPQGRREIKGYDTN